MKELAGFSNTKEYSDAERIRNAAPDLLETLIESRLYVEMAAKNCYNPVADNLLSKIDGLIAKAQGK